MKNKRKLTKKAFSLILYFATMSILGCGPASEPMKTFTNPDSKPTFEPTPEPGDGNDSGSNPGEDTTPEATAPNFEALINAGSTAGSYDLVFGYSPNATNDYDDGLDRYAPPPPPGPYFDAALRRIDERYYKNVLSGSISDLTEDIWLMQLQFPWPEQSITLSWDSTGWSNLGSFHLKDPFGGIFFDIDMTNSNVATLDSSIGTLDTSDPAHIELILTNTSFNLLNIHVTPFEEKP